MYPRRRRAAVAKTPGGGRQDDLARIVARVQSTRKYRHLCPDTIRRIAADEWQKRGTFKAAVKATQSRLHQIYAAYERGIDYERAYDDLAAAYATASDAAVKNTCRRLLARHASTEERLPILDTLYERVFAHTGTPASLLDLACGLHPLSLPWMNLPAGTRYVAYDIDRRRIETLNRWFALTHVRGEARLQDVICAPPNERADVALLLKSVPCLERQQAGSALALLDALQVRWVVVSFPIESLGRRSKGMPAHYEGMMKELLASRPWPVERIEIPGELVFVLDKEL